MRADPAAPAALAADRVVGVDGCRAGWIAVAVGRDGPLSPVMALASRFSGLLQHPDATSVIAVDMPIGLTETTVGPGRAAEQAVRPLLGARQSSVFSVPARTAVTAPDYAAACAAALATSTPPRKVSRQCWHLFPKILEIDGLLDVESANRVFETHPELAFWRLNGNRPLATPKKVKNRAHGPGIDERIALLAGHGFEPAFFAARRPSGVGLDDLVDAAANALMARRIATGQARPFPDPPARDGRGLRIAIWA